MNLVPCSGVNVQVNELPDTRENRRQRLGSRQNFPRVLEKTRSTWMNTVSAHIFPSNLFVGVVSFASGVSISLVETHTAVLGEPP